MVPLHLLVTDILKVIKSLLVTTKCSYVVEPLLRYSYNFKKMKIKALKRYFLYTSTDNVW